MPPPAAPEHSLLGEDCVIQPAVLTQAQIKRSSFLFKILKKVLFILHQHFLAQSAGNQGHLPENTGGPLELSTRYQGGPLSAHLTSQHLTSLSAEFSWYPDLP